MRTLHEVSQGYNHETIVKDWLHVKLNYRSVTVWKQKHHINNKQYEQYGLENSLIHKDAQKILFIFEWKCKKKECDKVSPKWTSNRFPLEVHTSNSF